MKINGIELEFNCMESQTARKYEKAVKHTAEMAGRTKEAKKEFQKIDILQRFTSGNNNFTRSETHLPPLFSDLLRQRREIEHRIILIFTP